jgi:hypothetical protein
MNESNYDQIALVDCPVLYYRMIGASTGYEPSLCEPSWGPVPSGAYIGGAIETMMPDGHLATVFDGRTGRLVIPDMDVLSVSRTGILTIETWIRPDSLTFPKSVSTGFIHWLSKSLDDHSEYAMRMYNKVTTDVPPRPNRISGYAYNPAGGQGAGSYFQDPVVAGQWIHVALVIDTVHVSEQYPTGFTRIYKNGAERDTDSLAGYGIVPVNGIAPLVIGTGFVGAVGPLSIYDYDVPADRLAAHYGAMLA